MTRRSLLLLLLGTAAAAGAAVAAAALAPAGDRAFLAPDGGSRGFEADDHFPGAARLYLAEPTLADAPPPAPARGTTGTAPLPPLPPEAAAITGGADPSIVAAQPFRFRGTPVDRLRAEQCLAAAIYYEAGAEPDAGQRAVAQVVLNRVAHPAFPATVCGVVYQGAERTSGCQFSFSCDGALSRRPSVRGWLASRRVAEAAVAGQVFAPVGMATHYHTYAVTPTWNRSLVMTAAIGAHFFHRWQGYWGTAAAFRQRYAGSEPVPGPPPRTLATDLSALQPLPLGLPTDAPTPAPTPEASAATPTPRATPTGRAAPRPAPTPLESGDVLPRWRDSGQALR